MEICPSCGGALNKLISHTSFILKGTGWYATDYGRKDRPHSKAENKSEDKKTSTDKSTEKTEKKESSAIAKES
jgi:predicted nucleic acid-binding Zn ribbon protein